MRARQRLKERRKALGYSQEGLAEELRVDRVTVGRWERGESAPHAYMWPRLARALRVPPEGLEALLVPREEFSAPSVSGPLSDVPVEMGYQDDMMRREFLRLTTLTGALVALPHEGPVPSEDAASAEGLTSAQLMTSHLWQVYGLAESKRSVYPLVHEQVSGLTVRMGRAHQEATHQAICGQAADLFQLAGEIFFDGNQYTEAAQCYSLAASASREARNADLWAAALTRYSFISLYEQRFQEAAAMLDTAGKVAMRGDGQLSTRHWVAAVQAQAHAGAGDLSECSRALDQAEEVWSLNDPCPGGWLRFDGSRMAEERGSCYVKLGRLDLAERALADALRVSRSLRRRGGVLIDLALIGAQRRDIDQLLSYGTAAIDVARQSGSGYVGRKLASLRPHLVSLGADRRVAELNEQISSLVAV